MEVLPSRRDWQGAMSEGQARVPPEPGVSTAGTSRATLYSYPGSELERMADNGSTARRRSREKLVAAPQMINVSHRLFNLSASP